uniref:cyclic nucleotide-binding domain-containing protein 1-like isoform X1 n=1 Tax=Styela clava TaxID=7725 RepID=UPI001939634A|nr:cyclic nucleotide-binding domain-containing protein 1-like isoform X1 [Styela clava]
MHHRFPLVDLVTSKLGICALKIINMAHSPEIDYDQLKMVAMNVTTHNEAEHDFFMTTYPSIFIRPSRTEPGIPNRPTKSFLQSHPYYGQKPKSRHGVTRAKMETQTDPFAKQDASEDARASTASSTSKELLHREELVTELHQIILKFPFERSRKEHKRVFELFFELAPAELISCIDNKNEKIILQQLVHAATHVVYPDTGMTVFGNSGLFMILKGSVRPQAFPYLNLKNLSDKEENILSRTQTPILKRRHIKLTASDCFGTFEKVPGKSDNSKIFSVITREPCEFLKISCNDFKRIITKITEEEQSKKMSLIQSCSSYKNWPNLSIKALARCVEWQHYSANTIILNEGEVCPFIGFIKSGRCEIFKSVEAVKTLPNNRKMRIRKQVCMGVLTTGDSVGETSMLMQELLTCSVIARTDVEIGIIKEERLNDIDDTTRTLLIQSSKPTFSNLTEDDIQQNFIAQEMKLDWEKLKHKVLLKTINYCGIRPGYGKWSH